IQEKPNEPFKIEIVGGHSGDNVPAGRQLRIGIAHCRGHRAGVAGGAVKPDHIDIAISSPWYTNRQVALTAVGVVFVEKTEGRIVLEAAKMLWKQGRQGAPDSVRNSAMRFGTD